MKNNKKTNNKTNNKNKRSLTRLLIILAIAIAAILLISLKLINGTNDKLVALVNGNKIYQSEIEQRLGDVFSSNNSQDLQIEKLPAEVIEILAKDIFAQKELDRMAKKNRVMKSKEVRKKIGEYTKKITRKEYLDSLIEERITEEVVRDKYIELVNELTGKKEIRIRHILTKTRNESQSVLNKVKAGQSFEKLAKNYSLDKMTSDQGGDLGYVLDSSLNQEFVDVVAAMKVGSVSNPIKTKYGWHIIKIEDIKDTEIMPFEDIKKSIEEELRQQEIKNIFSEIMDEAEVEVLINAKNSPTEVREEVKEEAKEVEGK